jgi:hypothetical protein
VLNVGKVASSEYNAFALVAGNSRPFALIVVNDILVLTVFPFPKTATNVVLLCRWLVEYSRFVLEIGDLWTLNGRMASPAPGASVPSLTHAFVSVKRNRFLLAIYYSGLSAKHKTQLSDGVLQKSFAKLCTH